jgi:hypothetical protein
MGRIIGSGTKHFRIDTFPMRTARDSRFLKSAEVAEALGVSKVTLKTWLRDGRIPEPARDPRNGYRLWTAQDVDTIRRMLRGGVSR